MQYLGGKQRIAKQIAEYLNTFNDADYYEPFVGANNIVPYLGFTKTYYLSDVCKDLILLHQFIQSGGIPDDVVSKELYNAYKRDPLPSATRGFIGFGCSFSGKWFGGYAKDSTGRNYARNAKNSLIKRWEKCKSKNIIFSVADYKSINPKNSIIYNDPPNKNTTKYDYTKQFDHDEFWNWVRQVSEHNIVLTSEYKAPSDFEVVLEIETKTDLLTKDGSKSKRVEKLFKYKG